MRPARLLPLIALVAPLVAPPAAAQPPALSAAVRAAMERFTTGNDLSGAVTLVGRADGVVSLDVVGVRDIASKAPMTPTTLFRIASMTKPVTAVAVMILVDEGKLGLDEPVAKYLPEFQGQMLLADKGKDTLTLKKPARPITVRDLLTHSSGLPGNYPAGLGDVYGTRDRTLTETIAVQSQQPLVSEPGAKWAYCNAGIDALGRLVEVAGGERFELFVQKRLFDPLGMTATTFYPTPEQQANLATVYNKKDGQLVPGGPGFLRFPAGSKHPIPCGGLCSTAPDLGRLYRMMLGKGQLDGKRILSEKAVAEMTRDQIPDKPCGFVPGSGMGLGWLLVRKPEGVTAALSPGTFGHGGYFGTQAWVDPVKGVFYVLLIQRVGLPNADGSPMRKALQDAAAPLVAMSPREAAARAVVTAAVGFEPAVFTGPKPPAVRLSPALAGKWRGSASFTDPLGETWSAVGVTPRPGPYLARISLAQQGSADEELGICGGPDRCATVFRAAKLPASDQRFGPDQAAALADLAGVPVGLVVRNARLVAEVCKERPFSELQNDPRFARLLAGLTLMPTIGDAPATRQNDAFAHERQAWVNILRTQYSFGELFPNELDRPTRTGGEPAPVVREGTEADAGVKPGTAAAIDAALTRWAADDDQAFAVCVVRRGVIVLHKAYGTRDGKPMTVETPSWMASVTKAMSATLMMMFVDRGLVSLDDPVSKFVPAFRGVKMAKPLLVRHLYTHTGGMADLPGLFNNDELPDLAERAAVMAPFLRVGREWKYGGQGYALGGKVIENVTGEAIPFAFGKHLLGPLGCTGTEVAGTHADAYSIPLDMAKFGQMLLNRGRYGPMQFFRPETFEQMLPRKLTAELGPDATKVFGIGLDGTPRKFGHGAASAATFSLDVDKELVVVVTRNKQGKNQDKYHGQFWEAIHAGIEK